MRARSVAAADADGAAVAFRVWHDIARNGRLGASAAASQRQRRSRQCCRRRRGPENRTDAGGKRTCPKRPPKNLAANHLHLLTLPPARLHNAVPVALVAAVARLMVEPNQRRLKKTPCAARRKGRGVRGARIKNSRTIETATMQSNSASRCRAPTDVDAESTRL